MAKQIVAVSSSPDPNTDVICVAVSPGYRIATMQFSRDGMLTNDDGTVIYNAVTQDGEILRIVMKRN